MSFEVILPFLRPIENLITDEEISEIMVNGTGKVFIERSGLLEHVPGVTVEENTLRIAVKNIARLLGDDISDEQPLLDSRLPDGSRVAAVLPPCSVGGTTLTIRKFATRLYTAQELVRIGSMDATALEILRLAVSERKNILISGGTSTGKTTMLNALATFIEDTDRIVLIEDTAELQLTHDNLVRFEARRQQPSLPAVTIRDLLKATLRHRPDRILLGEVRGAEAFDLLQALNTGHSGTLATIHANNAAQAITRLSSCVLQSGIDLPFHAIRSSIADCINLLVHIERRNGKRYVSELVTICRYDQAQDRFELDQRFRATPVDVSRTALAG
ncbi:MAG TPA: ATPase, T2SS/T4P/T4SS family [Bryobacteraceae bacterium]|nr:ATPase, T2SS/T4P/T4SS family [Bryobacteraceae bacterium]